MVFILSFKLQTPIFQAVIKNNIDIVKLLFENKADINAADNYQHTPLHFANLYKHIDIKLYLMEKGADKYIIPKSSNKF